uniref:Peroxidase n=1 Tax=Haemonchus placei TaxID=6290 RepID=A0A158QRC9_HAEPC
LTSEVKQCSSPFMAFSTPGEKVIDIVRMRLRAIIGLSDYVHFHFLITVDEVAADLKNRFL